MGHLEPVRIRKHGLKLDFDNRESFDRHHYAFKVSQEEFDAIFARIKERNQHASTLADRAHVRWPPRAESRTPPSRPHRTFVSRVDNRNTR